jgi:hypothetical protein
MRASTIMLSAIGLSILGRWAHNQKITATAVAEGMFAVFVIAMLDQGKTEPIAKGFAWLFFAAVMLGNNSPLTGLAQVSNRSAAAGQAITRITTV